MILTGPEIAHERASGRIIIEPFTVQNVNPNSYNFRLGKRLRIYAAGVLDPASPNPYEEIEIPDDGLILERQQLYLAHTEEVLGSDTYVPTFAARSSVARLGLFINLSASLGDIGYVGQWTLQLYAVNRIRVYTGMCVGQMMWWKPKGTVRLYSGKYQGAVGPRTSDIHVDFHLQLARQRLPGLLANAPKLQFGGKFHTLAALSRTFPVPDAFAIGCQEFQAALSDCRYEVVHQAFANMRGTVGVFADQDCRKIAAAVEAVQMPPGLEEAIRMRLRDLQTDGISSVAVRSSAIGEDGERFSLAGVHRTVLNLTDADAVIAAVIACWRSYYGPSAVLARVRSGDFSPEPRMAVIVQSMIWPDFAGVAFTRPGEAVDVEFVAGAGDGLMAGVSAPTRVRVTRAEDDAADLVQRVARLAKRVREVVGHDVDIEWAVDGRELWLLQCRPVTADPPDIHRDVAPVARTEPLYAPEPSSDAMLSLGAVREVVRSYRRKRGPAYRTARGLGANILPGWVVNLNRRALDDASLIEALRQTLCDGPAKQSVLDFGVGLRQQIVDKEHILERAAAALLEDVDDTVVHAFIVRDFIGGHLGIISSITGGELLVEVSPEGLLALNRGQASARRWIAADRVSIDQQHWLPRADDGERPITAEQTGVVAAVTDALDRQYGHVVAEWVIDRDILHFVDYSVVGTTVAPSFMNIVVLSGGAASGPVLVPDIADADLERLSVGAAISVSYDGSDELEWAIKLTRQVRSQATKPIVIAHRPYAALAVLIDHVAGFIFEDGATLCHLAILLREAKVPAVLHPDPPRIGWVRIDEAGVHVVDDAS